MNWHWPQWTFATIYLLALFGHGLTHDTPKTGKNNGVYGVLCIILSTIVLYYGGFWTPAP